MTEHTFSSIVNDVRSFAEAASDLATLQSFVVRIIPERISYYNWTGFYMLDPDDSGMLELGPYQGAPTEHVRIPISEGICGAAVAKNATVIVDDVTSDPRYLACSFETKSEIVTPIRVDGTVVGEIDVDSHTRASFSAADRDFLEECAAIVGAFMERIQAGPSEAK